MRAAAVNEKLPAVRKRFALSVLPRESGNDVYWSMREGAGSRYCILPTQDEAKSFCPRTERGKMGVMAAKQASL